MLLTEWNTDDAIAYARKEGREEGWEEGRDERDIEIVRNLFAEGFTIELVQKITGLDLETIEKIHKTGNTDHLK